MPERAAYGEQQKMAKNLVLMSRRRQLLLALLALPFAVFAQSGAQGGMPAGLRRWGEGKFRRFGFLVYEATLWAGEDPAQPPLALRLDYKRSLKGAAIADASVAEMRKFGADDATLERWGEQMARLFPDVRDGDHILGIHEAGTARFIYNGRLLGAINDPEFARQFFGIWLDPKTSAPDLRAALLKRPAG